VKVGNKTLSWLFDTSAAMTCMIKQSFESAASEKRSQKFPKNKAV
jgi:hypothetical protein